MDLQIEGRRALVTGAAGGIGAAAARALAAEGVALTLTDISTDGLDPLARETGALAAPADLSTTAGAEALTDEVGTSSSMPQASPAQRATRWR